MVKIFPYAAALLFASAVAAFAHDSKDDKVTVVYDQPLPNVPGKSIKGILVEYAPGAVRLLIPMQSRRLFTRPYWRGDHQPRLMAVL